jgi:hypothetical protein
MSGYAEMAGRLARVRRAWKRTEALRGLALSFVEGVGLFSVALLVDVLYRPGPAVRGLLLGAVLAAVIALLVRHVLKPVLRRIPDEQVALFVEERNPGFEGALMTAAEYRDGAGAPPEQARLIEAVLREAVRRGSRLDLRRLIPLGRLRKYALAAALVVSGYLLMAGLFGESFGYHFRRLARPWAREAADNGRAALPGRGGAPREPIRFRLSPGSSSIARGQSFGLEAVLSRFPERPVVFRFRPAQADAGAPWMELAMRELDRLNAYRIELPDVNEPLEFLVASGEFRSEACRLDVYERLALRGLELTLRYPAYLKLPESLDPQSGGEVAAPAGTKATLRVRTNNPLKGGRLVWPGRPPQEMEVQGGETPSAAASFEVTADAQYEYVVRDVHGQEVRSPGPLNVRVIPDKAPELAVTLPRADLTVHPLSEVTFLAEVSDDFGVDKVEAVFQPAREGRPEFRVPLALEPRERTALAPWRDARAQAILAFEDLRPRAVPTDTFTYHFEARDLKGQTAVSDLYVLSVGPFENWAVWEVMPAELGELKPPPLNVYLAAVWHLHVQKDRLKPDDFNRQSEELATSMEDPQTKAPFLFALPPKDASKVPPEVLAHIDACNRHVGAAHAALKGPHDTGAALKELRLALAELNLLGISDTGRVEVMSGAGGAAAPKEDAFSQVMLSVEKFKAEEAAAMAAGEAAAVGPAYRRELRKLEEAERLKKKAEDLKQEVQKLAQQAAQAKPEEARGGEEQAKAEEKAAERARELAGEAQKAAELDPQFRKAAEDLSRAANDLSKAARESKQGEPQKAAQEVDKAAKNIDKAIAALDQLRQQSLERTLDRMEAALQRLNAEQQMLRRQAEAVAKKQEAGRKPDAQEARDLKSMPLRQAQVRSEAEAVTKELEKQLEAARNARHEEVTRQLDNARQAERRGRMLQKMGNAVVALGQEDVPAAVGEQKQAEAALQKMLTAVRAATDALASDPDSELRRALNESRAIDEKISRLTPPADPKEAPKPAEERRKAGENLAFDLERLVRHLETRDLGDKDDVRKLKDSSQRPDELARQAEIEPAGLEAMRAVLRRVSHKLEKEVEARLEAKRLFSAMREEVPPQYRLWVNRYYEALGRVRR